MVIIFSSLQQNNDNLPLLFFGEITQMLSWLMITTYCIWILTGSSGYYYFIIVYVIQKIEE